MLGILPHSMKRIAVGGGDERKRLEATASAHAGETLQEGASTGGRLDSGPSF